MPKKATAKVAPVTTVEIVEAEVRKFTEAELFYITEKSKNQSAYDIANTLKCSIEDVQQHIPAAAPVPAHNPTAPESMMRNLMGGQSKNGTRQGIRVMTPQGSQFGDATRATRVNSSQEGTVIQGRNVDCIHKPLG